MRPMVDQSFWSDPDIEGQKAGVKLAALWLITNSQTSLLGLCGASDQRFKFETGLPSEALESAIKALPRSFIRIGGVVFLRNYVRHQFGTGDKLTRNNFFVALKSLFLSIKDADLQAEVLKEYPEFTEALQRASEGLTKPKERKGKEREGDLARPKDREQAQAYGSEIGMDVEQVNAWFDHFESNGWRVSGKTPMKDWKAAMRNGKRMSAKFEPNSKTKPKDESWREEWSPWLISRGHQPVEYQFAPEFLKSDFHRDRKAAK